MRNVATGMVALALAACAGTSPKQASAPEVVRRGQVGVEDLTATIPASTRMELSANENFLPPLPEPDNAPPAYPPELLAQRLPAQTVCLRVSIREDGAVASSAPLLLSSDCPDQVAPQFVVAAQAAVASWRFDPAVRCVFEHGGKPEYLSCVGAREVPQAVSLTYRFVFEQHDGHGSVRIAQ